jgi:hypothetical protein
MQTEKEKKEYRKQWHLNNKERRNKEHRQQYIENIDKRREEHKQYYIKNKEERRKYKYLNRYGLTMEQYNEMFNNQNGCCAICGIHQSELKRKLFVDHCHESGEVRKLLCNHCNLMLGNANDNKDILFNAIQYLEEYDKK